MRAVGGPDAGAEIGGSRDETQALREEGAEHSVAVDRLFEREPGVLVQTEHDLHAISSPRQSSDAILQAQCQVPIEAGVGCGAHVRREAELHTVGHPRADVQVAARDVECVEPLLFVERRGVLR